MSTNAGGHDTVQARLTDDPTDVDRTDPAPQRGLCTAPSGSPGPSGNNTADTWGLFDDGDSEPLATQETLE